MKFSESEQSQSDLIQPVETPASRSPANRTKPSKTLLVVEDEPLIRDFEVRFLRQQGYTVLQAEGAMEALRLATTAATIHLLITDFLMPEVDGLELTRRFREVHPTTPVLMVTGSLFMLPAGSELDLDRFELLEKPFQITELLHKVHSLLNALPPVPI